MKDLHPYLSENLDLIKKLDLRLVRKRKDETYFLKSNSSQVSVYITFDTNDMSINFYRDDKLLNSSKFVARQKIFYSKTTEQEVISFLSDCDYSFAKKIIRHQSIDSILEAL